MSPADFQTLKTELANDPLQLGYAGAANADARATLLQTAAVMQGPIPIPRVLIWAAKTGVMTKLQQRAVNLNDPLNSPALAVLGNMQGGSSPLDVTDADVMSMLGAFQASGDFTSDQATALLALGQVHVPRWQTIGLSEPPMAGDIAYAISIGA